MPLIKPRTGRIESVRHISRLQKPNRDALVATLASLGIRRTTCSIRSSAPLWRKIASFSTGRRSRARWTWTKRRGWPRPHPGRADHRRASSGLMRQPWTDMRAVVSLAGAALVGVLGLQAWPFPATDPILGLIALRRPALYRVLLYGYATVWFSTPFVLLQALTSLVFIYGRGSRRSALSAALPLYPDPATRDSLCLVLGEQHQRSVPEPAPQPRWLVIPEAGLYTGMPSWAPWELARRRAVFIPTSSNFWHTARRILHARWAASSWT